MHSQLRLNRKIFNFHQNHRFSSIPTYFICATMPPSDEHEEIKVQNTLALIHENPGMKATDTERQIRAAYHRVVRRLHGVPCSPSRGGRNKKLDKPESKALKEYLLMYHSIFYSASIDNAVATAKSILWYQRSNTPPLGDGPKTGSYESVSL